MNLFTYALHVVGSGAMAYMSARNLRDRQTRPNLLAGLQLAESGSVPFLEALRDRAAVEGDRWLAERLAQHARDELRHGQIFAHALKHLNKQVIDFKNLSQTEADGNSKEQRRSPFFEAYFAGYTKEQLSPQNIDWTVFFASTYILELDASRDFVLMADALESDPLSGNLQKGLYSVANDEKGHASYLREALERRLPSLLVRTHIDQWRTRKVNAMLAAVTSLVQAGGKMPALVTDSVPTDLSDAIDPPSTQPERVTVAA